MRSSAFPLSAVEMWVQASDVEVKGQSGWTRLHDPAGVILVARNGVITTALRAEYEKTYSPHLIACESCGFEYSAQEHGLTCPYCDHYKEIKRE